MYDIPAVPTFPDNETQLRVETSALRRRMLEGSWGPDLERYLQSQIDLSRRATWGSIDQSSNVFAHSCKALAVLYSEKPLVGVPREYREEAEPYLKLDGALDRSNFFSIMQSVQYKTIGIREMLVRVDISDSKELLFRPVTPDMVYASAPAGDPLKPNVIYEYRLRQNMQTKKMFWTADVYDLRDISHPKYQVQKVDMDGKFIEDMSDLFLGGNMDGENYPYRDSKGEPFLPWVVYHASMTGKLFNPYELSSVVSGSLQASTYYCFLKHLFLDSAWPQRFTVNAVLAGASTYGTGEQTQRMSVPADPASILCFMPDPDIQSQPMLGQFEAGLKDPNQMISAITVYERRLASMMGIDAASVTKVSSDPRSGYSIAMSQASMRDAQRRFSSVFRVGDLQAITIGAKVSNRFLGTNYPEEPIYSIQYVAVPMSPEELKSQRTDIIEKMDKGLMGPVEAIQDLYDLTEEEAVEKLRTIRQQRIEFQI